MQKGILIIALIIIAACTEKAKLDPYERIVNVECVLTNDTIQTLSLTYSSYVSESNFPTIDDAKIRVEETDTCGTKNVYTFQKNRNDRWISKFTPQSHANYKLEIDIPGEKKITAETVYPDTTVLRPDKHNADKGFFRNSYSINWTFDIYYPSTNKNFRMPRYQISGNKHRFILWIYGMDYNTCTNNWEQAQYISATDCIYDSFNISDIMAENIPEFKNTNNYDIEFPEVLEYGIPQYLHTIGYSNKVMNYRYLRMEVSEDPSTVDFTEDGDHPFSSFKIYANFKQDKYGIPHNKSHFVFEVVSEEYDQWLKDVLSFEMGIGDIPDSDLTHLWQTKTIYTNIMNGTGIFGASFKKKVPINDYEKIYDGDTGIVYRKRP